MERQGMRERQRTNAASPIPVAGLSHGACPPSAPDEVRALHEAFAVYVACIEARGGSVFDVEADERGLLEWKALRPPGLDGSLAEPCYDEHLRAAETAAVDAVIAVGRVGSGFNEGAAEGDSVDDRPHIGHRWNSSEP